MTEPRYLAPDWFTRNVFNRAVAGLTRIGLSVYGSRILVVRGRSSGLPRSVPVNVLTHEGNRYLVAPRGTTQWARNLRAAGEGDLRLGRRTEHFHATEIADAEKTEVLRYYLKRWAWEVGAFFDGVSGKASDDELKRIAPDHPIFKLG
jgi:deazaflavin-dependent oxidoreductase (nitroreductase family)